MAAVPAAMATVPAAMAAVPAAMAAVAAMTAVPASMSAPALSIPYNQKSVFKKVPNSFVIFKECLESMSFRIRTEG